MLIIILFLITAICAGLSIGKISVLLKLNEGIFTLTFYLVLFILAVSTGLDDRIVKSIDNIGWKAFLLQVASATGGTLICRIFYKSLLRRVTNNKLYSATSGR